MGKVTISFEMTLDGAFDQMDQWFDENDAGVQRASDELVFGADAVLLGRESYEFFREYWPKQTDDRGFAAHYNALPKYVASRTLQEPLEWNNSSLIEDDVAEQVSELKQQDGKDILVFGSGELARTLMQHDLIDEYRLMVFPLVVGKGKRLFGDTQETNVMELVDTKPVGPDGVLILTYRPAREEAGA